MINFIYVDLKDGTGGFMIPNVKGSKELVDELLKDSKYVLRNHEEDERQKGKSS